MALGTTPSQTIGPFFAILLPLRSNELVAPGSPGAIRIEGCVFDGAGDAVSDALIEFWQADPAGEFPGASDQDIGPARFQGFGRCKTGPEGRFAFVTAKPGRVPGWDERLQAPHINVGIFARGLLKRLATRLYFPDAVAANASDPVLNEIFPFERRQTLIAEAVRPNLLNFDIHLQGESETVFFAV